MFWTEFGPPTQIERASLDGTGRMEIIGPTQGVGQMSGLVIDYKEKRFDFISFDMFRGKSRFLVCLFTVFRTGYFYRHRYHCSNVCSLAPSFGKGVHRLIFGSFIQASPCAGHAVGDALLDMAVKTPGHCE